MAIYVAESSTHTYARYEAQLCLTATVQSSVTLLAVYVLANLNRNIDSNDGDEDDNDAAKCRKTKS